MKLYLIRHAESANNAIYAATGSWQGRFSDPDITELGHAQSQRLGALMADDSAESRKSRYAKETGFNLTHLYCSLMSRSILTANYISQSRGMPVIAHPDLFERGGIYMQDLAGVPHGLPGRSRRYFTERFPSLILPEGLTDDSGWYNRLYENETRFLERMKRVVPEIIAKHANTEDSVALVVHGRPYRPVYQCDYGGGATARSV